MCIALTEKGTQCTRRASWLCKIHTEKYVDAQNAYDVWNTLPSSQRRVCESPDCKIWRLVTFKDDVDTVRRVRRTLMASRIKRAFRKAISDPNYQMCRDRLRREFTEDLTGKSIERITAKEFVAKFVKQNNDDFVKNRKRCFTDCKFDGVIYAVVKMDKDAYLELYREDGPNPERVIRIMVSP